MLSEHIYDWNNHSTEHTTFLQRRISLLDDTLREGLQSVSSKMISIEEKLEIINLMVKLGIDTLNLGYPASSMQAEREVTFLAREITNNKLPIKIVCLARTHTPDIQSVINVSQNAGADIEVMTFIGSSPIRMHVEGWDSEKLYDKVALAVKLGNKAGLFTSFATEDTTRSRPDILEMLFKSAADNGARRFVLCDTVGHVSPQGVTSLVSWVNDLVKTIGQDIKLDWHGHNDRGLALANSLAAYKAGCDRIHATSLGIGERSGNTAMEQLLVNLQIMGILNNNLSELTNYCQKISTLTNTPISHGYPLVGKDAFSTAAGVHAAAIIKALEKGEEDLANLVYSAIPPSIVGRAQEIRIGPMSGKANVKFWLSANNVKYNEDLVGRILTYAKNSYEVLTDETLYNIIKGY